MKCLHNREKTSKKKKKKNRIFDRFLAVFGHFGGFWPFLDIFWPFLNSKVSEIMSYTCLPWPTTGATLHSARIMQKCAQNVQNCAQTSFFGPILAKKRIFDPRQNFFLLFSFQKWIPLEKLDIKHVLYDFLHAISIIFKGVKKNVSIALSNYTRNSCDREGEPDADTLEMGVTAPFHCTDTPLLNKNY